MDRLADPRPLPSAQSNIAPGRLLNTLAKTEPVGAVGSCAALRPSVDISVSAHPPLAPLHRRPPSKRPPASAIDAPRSQLLPARHQGGTTQSSHHPFSSTSNIAHIRTHTPILRPPPPPSPHRSLSLNRPIQLTDELSVRVRPFTKSTTCATGLRLLSVKFARFASCVSTKSGCRCSDLPRCIVALMPGK